MAPVPERDNRIEVICQHNREGEIIPIKLRVKDSDGLLQDYAVKSYKPVPHDLGLQTQEYECVVAVFGVYKHIRIFHNYNDHIWRIRNII